MSVNELAFHQGFNEILWFYRQNARENLFIFDHFWDLLHILRFTDGKRHHVRNPFNRFAFVRLHLGRVDGVSVGGHCAEAGLASVTCVIIHPLKHL